MRVYGQAFAPIQLSLSIVPHQSQDYKSCDCQSNYECSEPHKVANIGRRHSSISIRILILAGIFPHLNSVAIREM